MSGWVGRESGTSQRYDLVCPAKTAWELQKVRSAQHIHELLRTMGWRSRPERPLCGRGDFPLQRLKHCEFFMMPTSGHSAREPEIAAKLVEACNKYRSL